MQFNALKIYQNLIQFHLKENNLDALVDIDIHRLNFVNQNGNFSDKEAIYLSTLKSSKELFKKNEVSGLYAFEIAKIYRNKANYYVSNKNVKDRFKNKEAIKICNTIITQFPESLGATKCAILKNQIEAKSLSITSEKNVPINTNSRLLVNYKNIEKLHFTTYKITNEQLYKFNRLYKFEEKITLIKSLEKVTLWILKKLVYQIHFQFLQILLLTIQV